MQGKIRFRDFEYRHEKDGIYTVRGKRIGQEEFGYRLQPGETLGPIEFKNVNRDQLVTAGPNDIIEADVLVVNVSKDTKSYNFRKRTDDEITYREIRMILIGNLRIIKSQQQSSTVVQEEHTTSKKT